MIVLDSQLLEECRTSFFQSVGNVVEIEVDKTSSHQSVADRISDLKVIGVWSTKGHVTVWVWLQNIE